MRDPRYLPHLTWMEIRDLEKTEGVVVLPIGAIEQHGPHLPTATDALLAERLTQLALARLPESVRVWRLPVQSYGKSNEHLGFPGTVSLRAETLMMVVRDIAASLKTSGFRRLCFVNAHGGNTALLAMMAREIRAETGLMVFNTTAAGGASDPLSVPPLEARYGIHANDWETSVVLHLEPELVHMDRAVTEYPDLALDATVGLTQGAAVAAWLTRDWSQSGVFGDATAATPERGVARLEAAVGALTGVLEAVSRFEVARPTP